MNPLYNKKKFNSQSKVMQSRKVIDISPIIPDDDSEDNSKSIMRENGKF